MHRQEEKSDGELGGGVILATYQLPNGSQVIRLAFEHARGEMAKQEKLVQLSKVWGRVLHTKTYLGVVCFQSRQNTANLLPSKGWNRCLRTCVPGCFACLFVPTTLPRHRARLPQAAARQKQERKVQQLCTIAVMYSSMQLVPYPLPPETPGR